MTHGASGTAGSFDLSCGEELLWHEARGAGETPFVDCPPTLSLVLRLKNALHYAGLEAGLNEIVRRHDVLRSAFPASDERPYRLCAQSLTVPLALVDLRRAPADSRASLLQASLTRHVADPFDIASGPLFRAALFALDVDDHVFSLTVHHLVFDDWSRRVVARELEQLYASYSSGRPARLPALALPPGYRAYVEWQKTQIASARTDTLVDHWRTRVGVSLASTVTSDIPGVSRPSTRADSHRFLIAGTDAERLGALARQRRTTLATLMLAIFGLQLRRSGDTDEVTVGLPVSDRRRHEFEDLVGLFSNVVVVRLRVSDTMTFLDLLEGVRDEVRDAYAHQDVPYGHLLRSICARGPLYRVIYNFLPRPSGAVMSLTGLEVEPVPVAGGSRSVADMSLHVQNRPAGLACRVTYRTDLFSGVRIHGFSRQYQLLVSDVVDAPQAPIGAFAARG